MKKTLIIIMTAVILAMLSPGICHAGSVPEDLLGSDNAQLYFGEVLDYHENTETAVVTPVKNIKGDVVIGSKRTLEDCVTVGKKDTIPKRGEVCLIAYYDDVNPIYIFKVTSDNLPTLKIKNIEGADMWMRLQEYINDGEYTQAEIKRVAGQGLAAETNKETHFAKFLLSPLYTGGAFVISAVLILLYIILSFIKRRWSEIINTIAGCMLTVYGLAAAGGAKHYFLYRLYEKWGDTFTANVKEFIPRAIAQHSKSILILGSIAVVLIINGALLIKKAGNRHINIFAALSFAGLIILSLVLGFFSINKMFDIASHIVSFAYFSALWLFGILTIKNIANLQNK